MRIFIMLAVLVLPAGALAQIADVDLNNALNVCHRHGHVIPTAHPSVVPAWQYETGLENCSVIEAMKRSNLSAAQFAADKALIDALAAKIAPAPAPK